MHTWRAAVPFGREEDAGHSFGSNGRLVYISHGQLSCTSLLLTFLGHGLVHCTTCY